MRAGGACTSHEAGPKLILLWQQPRRILLAVPIGPHHRVRRPARWIAGVTLAAAFVGLLLTPSPTASTASECPPEESVDFSTGVCVPPPPKDIVEITPGPSGGLPEIDGVECTGHNSYECIGLAEESQAAGPTPTPHSSFGGGAPPTSSQPPG